MDSHCHYDMDHSTVRSTHDAARFIHVDLAIGETVLLAGLAIRQTVLQARLAIRQTILQAEPAIRQTVLIGQSGH